MIEARRGGRRISLRSEVREVREGFRWLQPLVVGGELVGFLFEGAVKEVSVVLRSDGGCEFEGSRRKGQRQLTVLVVGRAGGIKNRALARSCPTFGSIGFAGPRRCPLLLDRSLGFIEWSTTRDCLSHQALATTRSLAGENGCMQRMTEHKQLVHVPGLLVRQHAALPEKRTRGRTICH